jgi:energy-coupling factor transporter ATP-binding protein EcfA2
MENKRELLTLGTVKIENLTQRTIAVIGGKGTGKTQTLKMLSVVSPVKTVTFDLLNVIHEIDGHKKIIVRNKNINDGIAFAKILNKLKYEKLIISFDNFIQKDMIIFINDLFKEWYYKDGLIIMDEVHEITPEMNMGGSYSDEFERAVRHWRNKNVGFIFSTQRPAFTSKKVLGLIDYLILYRLTYTNDIEAVRKLISGMIPKKVDEIIGNLQTKQFLEGYTINFIPPEIKNHENNKLTENDKKEPKT